MRWMDEGLIVTNSLLLPYIIAISYCILACPMSILGTYLRKTAKYASVAQSNRSKLKEKDTNIVNKSKSTIL